MTHHLRWGLAAVLAALSACSRRASPPPKAVSGNPTPPGITQFYVMKPRLARGEKTLLCYGVENATKVWLSPPRRELSVTPARCVEVAPTGPTTYLLTAEGEGGRAVRALTVAVGPPKPKITEVRVSSLDIKRGQPVSICYQATNALSVTVTPALSPSSATPGCFIGSPGQTTTYTLTAAGPAGGRDQERVTVRVH